MKTGQQFKFFPASIARVAAAAALSILTIAFVVSQASADDDPPARVARLSLVDGDVSLAPSGDEQWSAGALNRPMSTGDRLATADGSRAELEVGGAALQVDSQSTLDVANLDDRNAQFELSSGSVNLYVGSLANGENYEVDTPTLAFVATAPGDYRIDIGGDGEGTTVKILSGAGVVYGENNASYQVGGQQSYQFPNAQLTGVIGRPLFRADDFDNFAADRNGRAQNQATQEYVSPDVVGSSDLDDNGQWADEPEYGQVWYPSNVDPDWAPYSDGHWVWIDPWGWSWVDAAPWGFAPFHYGRWAYLHDRWGWVPGPRQVRPFYSPALVAFVGGGGAGISLRVGGGPVGWFPLGPRDVYCPPYRVSQQYFYNSNVSNVNDRYVDRGRINSYYDHVQRGSGDGRDGFRPDFAYRNAPNAITVVSHDTFTGARPVGRDRGRMDPHEFANAPVNFRSPAAPVQQSLAQHVGGVPRPPIAVFSRPLVTHAQAPAPPPPFAARQPVITRNQGQPLAPGQLRQLQPPMHAGGQVFIPSGHENAQAGQPPQRGGDAGGGPNGRSPFDSDSVHEPSQQFRGSMPSSGFSPRGNEGRQQIQGGQLAGQVREQAPNQPDYQERRPIPIVQQPARPDYQSRPQAQEQPQQTERPQYQPRQQFPVQQSRPDDQERPQSQDRPQVQERPPVQAQQPQPRPQVQERPQIFERPQQPQPAPQVQREPPRAAPPPPRMEAPRPQPQPQREPPHPLPRDDKR